MGNTMATYPTNEERTAEYLKQFDRERTLKQLLKITAPIVFDVGANVGSTLEEFMNWWPEAEIHCFEPQEECWAALERRAADHRGKAGVVLNRFAAGSTSVDEAVFYSHAISIGISGFHKVNMESVDSLHLRDVRSSGESALDEYRQSMNRERTVKIVRLDEYMEQCNLRNIDLLKIDTQGYEPEVLDGLGERLADVRVVLAELMFYDYYERSLSFTDIERFLLPAGFRLFDISHIAKNPMNGRTDWVDVIYVNTR